MQVQPTPMISQQAIPVALAAPPMSIPRVLRGRSVRAGNEEGRVGDQLLAYQIRSIIGEGGMGIVYEAVQDYPSRTVALKVLKGALAEHGMTKRFEREVNILAVLRHPGIGQLFGAGTLEESSGIRVPFLAMERIYGLPIHQYCRKNRLSIPQRLELFLKVADAVEYVHTTGIVHRDLTCRNILVNEAGQPKVLDFGLATFVHDRREGLSVATVVGHPFGTLRYVSPEQAAGQVHAIDRQTDVYALGVVLYKILAGRHPLSLTGLSMVEAVRHILQVEPPPLSQRNRKLKGDLQTIAHKALSKNKHERYATVAEFAADVRRYLRNEPIHARRPTAAYLSRKFVRRHRGLVSTAALIALSLSVGAVASLREASRANLEAARATREASRANTEAARANMEAREAMLQLARAEVAQGDALFASQRYLEARSSYDIAWQQFRRAGESPRAAELALWELNQVSARPLKEILPASQEIERLVISPDQRWLASTQKGVVEVRDIVTNQPILRFQLDSQCRELVASADSRLIAASDGAQCVVWDIAKLSRVGVFAEYSKTINRIALGDGAVAMATAKRKIILQRFAAPRSEIAFPEKTSELRCLAFASGGELLAVDHEWRVWRYEDWSPDFSLVGTLPTEASNRAQVAISPQGKSLAVFGADGSTTYSLPQLKELAHWPSQGSMRRSGYAKEGVVFLGSATQDRYELCAVDGPRLLVLPKFASDLGAFAGDLAVVASANRSMILWSVAPCPGMKQLSENTHVCAATISRDGKFAALWGKDGFVRIHDLADQHVTLTLDVGGTPRNIALNDAATELAVALQETNSGESRSTIQFWDLKTGKKLAHSEGPGAGRALALARTGSVALSGEAADGAPIKFWRKSTEGWSSTPVSAALSPSYLDLSPDAKSFLSSGNPVGIEYWDVEPSPLRRFILAGSMGCGNAVFAEDGKLIVARNTKDRTLRIWNSKDLLSPPAIIPFQRIPGSPAPAEGSQGVVCDGGELVFVDFRKQQIIRRVRSPLSMIRTVSLDRNGQRVIAIDGLERAFQMDFNVSPTIPVNDLGEPSSD